MKKTLLALALTVATMPSFNASADGALTELWQYQTTELNADYDFEAPDWSSTDAIKAKPCARFATAADGKFYTINMKTMSIAEVTENGWRDLYRLPKPENPEDYYGTAISMDEVGNFLIGHYFTNAPKSSLVWSIYSPATGEITTFTLEDNATPDLNNPRNTQIGRIDCVGRVLGDLTSEAQFFIAPQYDAIPHTIANDVRAVSVLFEDGETIITSNFYPIYNATIKEVMPQGVVQPREHTYEEFCNKHELEQAGFILYAKPNGDLPNVAGFDDKGIFDWSIYNAPFRKVVNTNASGFDLFEINGETYYAVNYSEDPNETNTRGMYVGIVNSDGDIVASWQSDQYASNNGFSTIIAEPLDNGTANIYIYNSASDDAKNSRPGRIGAAMLNFNPSAVTDTPELSYNPSFENAIEISTPEELKNLTSLLTAGENCVVLTADLDMTDIEFKPLLSEGNSYVLHFDGRGHVIRNLKIVEGNASLFGSLTGSVRNLGLENIDYNKLWYCVGGIAGQASKAVIDNCYTTGQVVGAAVGGIIGATSGEVVITNCYTLTDVNDETGEAGPDAGYAGGFIGRADSKVTIRNSFAKQYVSSKGGYASGIVTVRKGKKVNLENVVAWNYNINGGSSAEAIYTLSAGKAEVSMTNVYVSDETYINDEPAKDGKSEAVLSSMIHSWEAFHSTEEVDGTPVLKWQIEGVGGINDIIVDEAIENAPAVYYNLQGVKVNNPANGVYIVRRGNKVAKEFVK